MGEGAYWIGIGDIHDDAAAVARVPGLDAAAGVVVTGDLTIKGGVAAAKAVIEAVRRENAVIMAQIGNMDKSEVDAYLTGEGVNLHATGRVTPQGVGFFGCGYSTPTPFGTPSEAGEERIAAWLEAGYAAVAHCPRLVMVCHTPPYGTATDVIGGGVHVGSRAVRAFIERTQPAVCLTGHIHEARAVDRIGQTTVVNPGALSGGGFVKVTLSSEGLRAELLSFS